MSVVAHNRGGICCPAFDCAGIDFFGVTLQVGERVLVHDLRPRLERVLAENVINHRGVFGSPARCKIFVVLLFNGDDFVHHRAALDAHLLHCVARRRHFALSFRRRHTHFFESFGTGFGGSLKSNHARPKRGTGHAAFDTGVGGNHVRRKNVAHRQARLPHCAGVVFH